jgi:hypothetical protein
MGDELSIEFLKTESSLCRGCQESGDKEDIDDGSTEDLGVPSGVDWGCGCFSSL